MASHRHSLVIGVLGLGLAVAMFFDGAFGGSPTPPPPIVNQDQKPNITQENKTGTKDAAKTFEKEEKKRLQSYEEKYKRHLERKKRKEEEEVIKQINTNAYTGDGSGTSRRLYLLHQAYKASREATPVIVPKKKKKTNISDDASDSDESECTDLKELANLLADDISSDDSDGEEDGNKEEDGEEEEEEEEAPPPTKTIKVPPPPAHMLVSSDSLGHSHAGMHAPPMF